MNNAGNFYTVKTEIGKKNTRINLPYKVKIAVSDKNGNYV